MSMTILGCIIFAFVAGTVLGGLIVYKYEEYTLTTMFKQCAELSKAERELREEQEECRKTRAMLTIIDDVPEYFRDNYDISEGAPNNQYREVDEDYDAIYN